jgi:hypothetical protein
VSENGGLVLHVEVKPEMVAAMSEAGEEGADEEQPPIPLALIEGDGDPYVVTDGAAKGMRGYFSRGADGQIAGVHVGGRMAMRT